MFREGWGGGGVEKVAQHTRGESGQEEQLGLRFSEWETFKAR